MRQLHVVALSEDGRFLLLAPGKGATKGTHRVPLDDRLTAAVRGELPRPGESAVPVSDLTPKQIQTRLRGGETVEEIARSAGVPASRVERFAGPVEGEKARVIEAARAAVLTRARRGASAVSLGEAVAAHLLEVDVDPAEVLWTARREDGGDWLVEASYTSRGRRKRSTWRYEPGRGELTAADASSAVLGYVEPEEGRPAGKVVAAASSSPSRRRTATKRAAPVRRSSAAPRVPAAAKAPAAARAAGKAPTTAPPAARTRGAQASGAGTSGSKAGPTGRSTAAGAKPATTTVAPAGRAAPGRARKAPARSRAAAPEGARTPTARRAEDPQQAPSGPPQLRVVPPPGDEPRPRASVPTWADVLLSTTPPSRPAAADDDSP